MHNHSSPTQSNVSADTAQLLKQTEEYTKAITRLIASSATRSPSEPLAKLLLKADPYSLEQRAAIQVVAAFDRMEEYSAALVPVLGAGTYCNLIVTQKGQSPYDFPNAF